MNTAGTASENRPKERAIRKRNASGQAAVYGVQEMCWAKKQPDEVHPCGCRANGDIASDYGKTSAIANKPSGYYFRCFFWWPAKPLGELARYPHSVQCKEFAFCCFSKAGSCFETAFVFDRKATRSMPHALAELIICMSFIFRLETSSGC